MAPCRRSAATALGCVFGLAALWFAASGLLRPTHVLHERTVLDDDVIEHRASGLLRGTPPLGFGGSYVYGATYASIGRRWLPLDFYHHGAWSVYFAAPFVAFGKRPGDALGLAASTYLFLALAANFGLVFRVLGGAGAGLSTYLLALGFFVNYFSLSYTYVPFTTLFLAAAVFFVHRWRERGRAGGLYSAAFMLGVGFGLQDRFAYALAGFVAACAVCVRERSALVAASRALDAKRSVGALAAFGAGSLPIALAIVVTQGDWLRRWSAPHLFGEGLSYPAALNLRFVQLTELTAPIRGLGLAAVLLWVLLVARTSPALRIPSRFAGTFALAYWLSSPFTLSAPRVDHLLDFLPVWSWLAAIAFADIVDRAGMRRWAPYAALVVIAVCTRLAVPEIERAINIRDSSVWQPRDDFNKLLRHFRERGVGTPYVSDFGLAHALALHSRGAILPDVDPTRCARHAEVVVRADAPADAACASRPRPSRRLDLMIGRTSYRAFSFR